MADTLEQVTANQAKQAPKAPPAKPRRRLRGSVVLPEKYPNQGFSLGEMPLTLFILLAAAILYLHLSGAKGVQMHRGGVIESGPSQGGQFTEPPAVSVIPPTPIGPPPPKVDLPAGEVLIPVAPGTPVPTLHEP